MKQVITKRLLSTITLGALAGCGSLGSKSVSLDYPSYKEMIESELKEELWIPLERQNVNPFAMDELVAPVKAISAFCKRDQGSLLKVEQDKDAGQPDVRTFSGLFACRNVNERFLWMVNVDASRRYMNWSKTNGYMLKVTDYPVSQYLSQKEILKQAQIEQERIGTEKKTRFFEAANMPKSKGDKVCTWRNHFGFVEEIADDKVRISIKGRANTNEGIFFEHRAKKFAIDKIEETIWDSSSNWAHCNFLMNGF